MVEFRDGGRDQVSRWTSGLGFVSGSSFETGGQDRGWVLGQGAGSSFGMRVGFDFKGRVRDSIWGSGLGFVVRIGFGFWTRVRVGFQDEGRVRVSVWGMG